MGEDGMKGSKAGLASIKTHVIALARELRLSEADFSSDAIRVAPPRMNGERLLVATAWQRANEARRQAFTQGERLFADPAWEILLELYIRWSAGSPTSVSRACAAAKVPHSTSLRWLKILLDEGLIDRIDDPDDRRRSFVELTAEAREKIEAALDAATDSDQRLGLARLAPVQTGEATGIELS
jgi:DNA-binding MarR family transcriptional regulator